MKKLLASIFTVLFLTACASAPKVPVSKIEAYNDLTNYYINHLEEATLLYGEGFNQEFVFGEKQSGEANKLANEFKTALNKALEAEVSEVNETDLTGLHMLAVLRVGKGRLLYLYEDGYFKVVDELERGFGKAEAFVELATKAAKTVDSYQELN